MLAKLKRKNEGKRNKKIFLTILLLFRKSNHNQRPSSMLAMAGVC